MSYMDRRHNGRLRARKVRVLGPRVKRYYEVCSGCSSARPVIGEFKGEWKKQINTVGLLTEPGRCPLCGPVTSHTYAGYTRSKVHSRYH